MSRSSPADVVSSEALVSVVVPIYNGDRELVSRCLSSIRGQSHPRLDLVVVDDGSQPSFARWLDEQAELDVRTRVIHQPNRGVSMARNTGITAALGDYICFVDGDDFIQPEFIERALNVARSTEAQVVFGGITILHQDARYQWRSSERKATDPLVLNDQSLTLPRALALSDSPSPWADSMLTSATNVVGALYATSLVRTTSFRRDVGQAEDRLFNFDVLGIASRAAFCSESWYVYDQTVVDSATKAVGADGGQRLRPVISAFASVANGSIGSTPTPDELTIRSAASQGLLNYLKLAATLAAEIPSRKDARSVVKAALDLDGVDAALAWAPAHNKRDLLFRWVARRGWASGALLLGRMAASSAR